MAGGSQPSPVPSRPIAPVARVRGVTDTTSPSDAREVLLARAAEAEAAGRLLDAVDALQAADRLGADLDVETRLVNLRHAAYEELRDPARPDWPPSYPDPFPDVVGAVPEITRDQLTTEVLGGAILHHGSLLVRGLLSDETAAHMRSNAEQTFTARYARKEGVPLSETAPWFVPFRKGVHTTFGWQYVVRVPDSPPSMSDLVEVYRSTGVVDAITGYLGERPALSSEKCCFRRAPVTELNENYHQDGAFFGEECRTVNCWIALSHCGDTAPGIDVLPKRVDRVVDTGTVGAGMYWTIAPDVVAAAGDGVEVVRPVFEPGDALIFDHLCIHRTAVDLSMTSERLSIECWFFGPSTYPERDVPIVI